MGSDPEFARLRWRCRRGMRELDRLLEQFLDSSYSELSPAERGRFAEFLELPDPELYAYLLGRKLPEDPDLARVMECIRRVSPA